MNESATRAGKAQEQLHGTPSFLGAAIGELADLGVGRVALSGVFCDHFSGGQPGARFAPRQLRYAAHSIPVSKRLCLARSQRTVLDIGDLNVFPLQATRNAQALSRQSEAIALSGAKLLAIGGDYSITPHLVEGLLRAHQGRNVGMLRLSRRLDAQSSAELSTRASASRRVGDLLCGNAPGDQHANTLSNILFVGASSPITAEELASVSAANMISMHALTNTTDSGLAAALRALRARCDGFYLSVDADVLSPLYGETCEPRSGVGLSPAGLAEVLDQLEHLPILGADVMGHVPDLDLAGITATAIILSVVSRITELLLESPRVA